MGAFLFGSFRAAVVVARVDISTWGSVLLVRPLDDARNDGIHPLKHCVHWLQVAPGVALVEEQTSSPTFLLLPLLLPFLVLQEWRP
jgi:hypothetical protein